MINTHPLAHHTKLSAYGDFLLKRFVFPHFGRGSKEVHVIFDNPGRLQNTPKFFEQKRRDEIATISASHMCMEMTEETKLTPRKWRENVLNCRVCKRNLVIFLGTYFLHHSSIYLNPQQALYIAGSFTGQIEDTAWFVTDKNQPQPDPIYRCNAEEADTRLWLHALQTSHNNILLITPDTDVYVIGLALLNSCSKDVIAQVNPFSSRELRLLHLSNLIGALEKDPDLGKISTSELPQILQTLYVCTGCDYVSLFSRLGKATFLRYFFQYATFITGKSSLSTPGTLGSRHFPANWKVDYLAFLRLVGTVYFKKYSSGFTTQSPATYYSSFDHLGLSPQDQHHKWLDSIRETIWYRTQYENEMMASNTSLQLHWLRSCWVLHLWGQANANNMILEPMSEYGWCINNDKLTMQWDTTANMAHISKRIQVLTKGCKCATGCSTNRCGCRRKGSTCSAGCECTNCCNDTPGSFEDKDTDSAIRDLSIEENIHHNTYEESEDMADFLYQDVEAIMNTVFNGEEHY